jgi:hypothetical protein
MQDMARLSSEPKDHADSAGGSSPL